MIGDIAVGHNETVHGTGIFGFRRIFRYVFGRQSYNRRKARAPTMAFPEPRNLFADFIMVFTRFGDL